MFKEVELLPWMTSDGAGEEAVQYSTVCNQLKVAFNPDTNPQHRLFGMSSRNRLYCDDLEIATGIRYAQRLLRYFNRKQARDKADIIQIETGLVHYSDPHCIQQKVGARQQNVFHVGILARHVKWSDQEI